jgi:hypothetical protein
MIRNASHAISSELLLSSYIHFIIIFHLFRKLLAAYYNGVPAAQLPGDYIALMASSSLKYSCIKNTDGQYCFVRIIRNESIFII